MQIIAREVASLNEQSGKHFTWLNRNPISRGRKPPVSAQSTWYTVECGIDQEFRVYFCQNIVKNTVLIPPIAG